MGAQVTQFQVFSADANGARIGHFGLFRDQFQTSLWARVEAMLRGFPMSKETA